MENLLALMIGLGLSAACGFRVFVPLLAMSLAAQTGHLELADSFQWIATPMTATVFTTGGLGNPVVSTGETVGSILLSLFAVLLPLAAMGLVLLSCVWAASKLSKRFKVRNITPGTA